jgi:tagaturonate reductase
MQSMERLNVSKWKESLSSEERQLTDRLMALPEKVLQFGTGVLLRGLPDYFIDLANKKGQFQGRIVVIKSTSTGGTEDFNTQDCLYTHLIRGVEQGAIVEEAIVNASISRVLSAQSDWTEILHCAENPEMGIIISNTTEAGLTYRPELISEVVPESFPGKLLAWLLHRYRYFGGDPAKGMIIIPTELVTDNGAMLTQILIDLARFNSVSDEFIHWLTSYNEVCTSLVDRIVPGKPSPEEQARIETEKGYSDRLMIVSEPYALWAIAVKKESVRKALAFSQVHKGVVIAPDISIFLELKLRLLNGSHTFSCGLAYLCGFRTVREAMQDSLFSSFVEKMMLEELVPSVTGGGITQQMAHAFAISTLDRYRNPFIEHPWINITLQYSAKMRIRNLPTIQRSVSVFGKVPSCMCLGFAAYILFMKGNRSNEGVFMGYADSGPYPINDDYAFVLADLWEKYGLNGIPRALLSDDTFWGMDMLSLPGFMQNVNLKLQSLSEKGALKTLALYMKEKSNPGT